MNDYSSITEDAFVYRENRAGGRLVSLNHDAPSLASALMNASLSAGMSADGRDEAMSIIRSVVASVEFVENHVRILDDANYEDKDKIYSKYAYDGNGGLIVVFGPTTSLDIDISEWPTEADDIYDEYGHATDYFVAMRCPSFEKLNALDRDNSHNILNNINQLIISAHYHISNYISKSYSLTTVLEPALNRDIIETIEIIVVDPSKPPLEALPVTAHPKSLKNINKTQAHAILAAFKNTYPGTDPSTFVDVYDQCKAKKLDLFDTAGALRKAGFAWNASCVRNRPWEEGSRKFLYDINRPDRAADFIRKALDLCPPGDRLKLKADEIAGDVRTGPSPA